MKTIIVNEKNQTTFINKEDIEYFYKDNKKIYHYFDMVTNDYIQIKEILFTINTQKERCIDTKICGKQYLKIFECSWNSFDYIAFLYSLDPKKPNIINWIKKENLFRFLSNSEIEIQINIKV